VRIRLLMSLLVLTPLPLLATPLQFEVARKIELQPLENQGFTPLSRPRLVDRDRAVYVADRPDRAHLVWLDDHTEYALPIPVRRSKRRGIRRSSLLFVDSPHERASVLLTERNRLKRYSIATWNLATNREIHRVEVARINPRRAQSELLPLGYSPEDRLLYCQETHISRHGQRPWTVTVFAMVPGENPWQVGRIQTERRIHHVYYDGVHGRALAVEYAERGNDGPAPRGHLFDLHSGEIRTLPLPLTAYGIAFSRDRSRIHAYSSQLGQVWSISTETRDIQWRRRIGGLGHALGTLGEDYLLLIREAGLQIIHADTGRSHNFFRMSRFVDGISHPEGSLVTADQAIVRNGTDIHFVRILNRDHAAPRGEGNRPAPR